MHLALLAWHVNVRVVCALPVPPAPGYGCGTRAHRPATVQAVTLTGAPSAGDHRCSEPPPLLSAVRHHVFGEAQMLSLD